MRKFLKKIKPKSPSNKAKSARVGVEPTTTTPQIAEQKLTGAISLADSEIIAQKFIKCVNYAKFWDFLGSEICAIFGILAKSVNFAKILIENLEILKCFLKGK